MLLLKNYLSNQRVITLFAHLFDQSACYYSFFVLFIGRFMVTCKQHNIGLTAHSSMELKYTFLQGVTSLYTSPSSTQLHLEAKKQEGSLEALRTELEQSHQDRHEKVSWLTHQDKDGVRAPPTCRHRPCCGDLILSLQSCVQVKNICILS